MKSPRKFTREFKLSVLNELESGKPAAQICREHSIGRTLLYTWKSLYKKYPETAFRFTINPSCLQAGDRLTEN